MAKLGTELNFQFQIPTRWLSVKCKIFTMGHDECEGSRGMRVSRSRPMALFPLEVRCGFEPDLAQLSCSRRLQEYNGRETSDPAVADLNSVHAEDTPFHSTATQSAPDTADLIAQAKTRTCTPGNSLTSPRPDPRFGSTGHCRSNPHFSADSLLGSGVSLSCFPYSLKRYVAPESP